MRIWAKKTFVPCDENRLYPRFWGWRAQAAVAAVTLAAALALVAVPALFRRDSFLASILPGAIVALTNEERAEASLGTLAENPLLVAAAQAKADDMAARGYFAHVTPEGLAPWHWLDAAGYEYASAGENLAVNFADSEDVVDAWMDSPSHRANIEKARYTEIGVAMAKGPYKGRQAIFVVQFFGAPKGGATAVAAGPRAVEPAPARPAATGTAASATPVVAGASIDAPDFVASLAASPRSAARSVLWAIFAVVAVALALAVAVKPKVQFGAVIATGVLVLAAVGALLLWDARGRETLVDGPATSTPAAP